MTLEINYWNLEGHEPMLFDAVRCEAFRKAIAAAVGPGGAVLDLGAGTGILSVFAAQAGARAVYAVERTRIAELARRIVAENGFHGRIHVLRGDVETIELPEKVDLIVSEWLGGYGVDENLLPVVVQARDRWLRPGGRMIPGTVEAWMARPSTSASTRTFASGTASRTGSISLLSAGSSKAGRWPAATM